MNIVNSRTLKKQSRAFLTYFYPSPKPTVGAITYLACMISESLIATLEPYKPVIKVAVIVALAVAINKIMRYTLGAY